MVERRWFLHWVFIGTIVLGELIQCKISHENELPRETRAAYNRLEKPLLRPVPNPSKNLLKTTENQLKQAVNKLPNVLGWSTNDARRLRSIHVGGKKNGLYFNQRRNHSVSSNGALVEVIDERQDFNGEILKRDEIRRPDVSVVWDSDSKMVNASPRKMEQTVTEVIDDNGRDKYEQSDIGQLRVKGEKSSMRNDVASSEFDSSSRDSVNDGRDYKYRNDASTNSRSSSNKGNSKKDHNNVDNNRTVNSFVNNNKQHNKNRLGIFYHKINSNNENGHENKNNNSNVGNNKIKYYDYNNNSSHISSNNVHNNNRDDTENSSSNGINSVQILDGVVNGAADGDGITDEQFNKIKNTVNELVASEKDDAMLSAPPSSYSNNGNWSHWLTWSACSKSCGDGVRMRLRTCRNMVSENSDSCSGSSIETQRCGVRHCPVDGQYTDWTSWSSCSETCGRDSIQMRMRICMNPQPQYGGKDCPGSRFKVRYCAMKPCRDNLPSDETKNSESGTDEVLENLKTILQVKTANLEQALSDEPTNTASQLFDTIYESGKYKNTTASKEAQNVDQTAHTKMKKTENIFSDKTEESSQNLGVNETDNAELSTLSSLLDKYKEENVDLSDEKVAERKEHFAAGQQVLKEKNLVKFGNMNVTGKILTSLDRLDNTRTGNREQNKENYESLHGKVMTETEDNNKNATEFKSVFNDDHEGRMLENEDERLSTDFDKQNPILNVQWSPEAKSPLAPEKLIMPNLDHSVIYSVENTFEKNETRQASHTDSIYPKTHNISEEIDTRPALSIMGKIRYNDEQESDSGKEETEKFKSPTKNSNPAGDISKDSNNHQVTKVLSDVPEPKHGTETLGFIRQELDADFLPWTEWSTCSLTCGEGGVRSRRRTCKDKKSPNCIGPRHDTKKCFVRHCAVNGGWSVWSDWTPCSQTCGKSVKVRMRKCNTPAPLYGGKNCEGNAEEHLTCDVLPCPENGHWSVWSDWTGCSQSCGGGYKFRTRTCSNPYPSNGGLTCKGENKEHSECYLPECPVDGGFSHWHSWSKCRKTCGPNSFRTRFRFCNNPPPSDGGKPCRGDRFQLSSCVSKPCPVDGGLSAWSNWSECSIDCRPGSVKRRIRICSNPKPLYGGADCVGDVVEEKKCGMIDCKVDGGLSQWTTWSPCSQSCEQTAVTTRERFCNKPYPSGEGKNCSGQTFQIKFCERKSCEPDAIMKDTQTYDEKNDSSLVQTILDEKEELLKDKKSKNKVDFSSLKEKLIENLKKLSPDLSVTKDNEDETSETISTDQEKGHESKTVTKMKISDRRESKVNASPTADKIQNNMASILNEKIKDTGDTKERQRNLKDPDDKLEDSSEQREDVEDINPIKSCGFNPCKIARCLSDPFADCIPNKDCDPVYYDVAGNRKKDCSVETTFLTVPAYQLCEQDPCKTAVCMNMPMTKCVTSALCHPVYFDETGNVINCTGILKTPVTLTCGRDPCLSKFCPSDPDAKCFTSFQCKSTFWNMNYKEEIHECRESDKDEDDGDGQENADERSETSRRPWMNLDEAALRNKVKKGEQNGVSFGYTNSKHFPGKKKFRLLHRHTGLKSRSEHDNEHYEDDDETDDDYDQTDDDEDENNSEGDEIPFSNDKNEQGHFGLPRIPANKIKEYNNARKNPVLTLTSLNTEQYENQGGNGVDVTKDWKLKLKPPTNLDGYVESPQVYKIKTLKQDTDENTEDLLHHRKNDQDLTIEGLSSDGMSSEDVENAHRFHQENMQFTPSSSTRPVSGLDSVDRLLKNDELHQGNEETGESARALLQPDSYAKVMKQDLSDVESALDSVDNSNAAIGGLSSIGSPGIHEEVVGTVGDTGRDTLSMPTLERGIVPENPLDTHKDYQLSYSQDGRYVPLDNVIDDLRTDISRKNDDLVNPENLD